MLRDGLHISQYSPQVVPENVLQQSLAVPPLLQRYVKQRHILHTPQPAGQRLVLLTDVTTADAAEWFVRTVSASARALTVGRATCGSLDYSNPLAMAFEDRFILVYPMTKTKACADGHGMRGVGLAPDVRVPLTPAECARDVVLERALQA